MTIAPLGMHSRSLTSARIPWFACLNATCSGRSAARVHHACPQPTTVCSVIDLEDRRVVSNNYCSAVTVADTVLCSCGFNRYDTDKSSSNNETVSAILALNGKLSIGAFRSFATGELDASVTAVVVQSLSTNQFLEASKMVLFAFATFWILAMVCIGLVIEEDNLTKLTLFKPHKKKIGNDNEQNQAVNYSLVTETMARLNPTQPYVNSKRISIVPISSFMNEPSLTTEVQRIAQVLEDYLYALIPVIYRYPLSSIHKHPHQKEEKDTFLQGIYQVFYAQHRVLRILMYASEHIFFLSKPSSVSRSSRERTFLRTEADTFTKQRILFDIIYLVTAITMSCFVLAILYDLQYPVDDGYCTTIPSAAACEYRKTLLDPWQSRCLWVSSHPYNDDTSANLAPYTVMIVESLQGAVIRSMRYNTVSGGSSSANDDADLSSDGYCRFNNNNNSLLAFVFSYLVTLTFAGVLALFLNSLMHTLSSHVRDRHRRGRHEDLYYRFKKDINLNGLSHNDDNNEIQKQGTSNDTRQFLRELFPSDVLLEETFHLRHNVSPATILLRQSLIEVCTTFATNHHIDGHVVSTTKKMRKDNEALVSNSPHSKLFIDQWVNKHTYLSQDVFGVMAAQLYIADSFFTTSTESQRGVNSERDTQRHQLAQAKRTLFLYSLFRFFPVVHIHPSIHPTPSSQHPTNFSYPHLHRFWVSLSNWLPTGETPLWIPCLWTLLIAMNAGALYFIFSKAAVRGYDWQRSFLLISLWEIVSEWLLLQSLEIGYFDVWLPWWIREEVQVGIQRICVSVICKLVDQVFPGSTPTHYTNVDQEPHRISTMFVDATAATGTDSGHRDVFETFVFDNVQTTLWCEQRHMQVEPLGDEIQTIAPTAVTHEEEGGDTRVTGGVSMVQYVTTRISVYYTRWREFRLKWLASCSLMFWETTFVMWFTLNMAWLIYLFYQYVKPFYLQELPLVGQVGVLLGVGVVAVGWVSRCYWLFHYTKKDNHRRKMADNRYQRLYERISLLLDDWDHSKESGEEEEEEEEEEQEETSRYSFSDGETAASFMWEEDTGEESAWEMSSDARQISIHSDDEYLYLYGEEEEDV